ncbi:hypothetical protein lbkm_2603 [Lachnospiraceae bacterium KM106-2]|nr:hypothetical protein lbkm_2603 [Lachnospiraceae bacterium KM106-2]
MIMILLKDILMWIIIVIIGRTLAVAIHEVGHVIAYSLQGIPIRAIFIFGLVIIHEEKWHIDKCRNPLTIHGGMVLADFSSIDSEEKYIKTKRKHINSLLWGVIGSGISCIVAGVGSCYITNDFVRYILYIFSLYSLVIIVFAFCAEEKGSGDIAAAYELRRNELRTAIQFYGTLLYTRDAFIKIQNSQYLHELIISKLVEDKKSRSNVLLIRSFLDQELVLYLIGIYEKLDIALVTCVDQIIENPYTILDQPGEEENYILLTHIILYLVNQKECEMARKLYQVMDQYSNKDSEIIKYDKEQIEYWLKLRKQDGFVGKREAIKATINYQIDRLFPVYYEIENKLNGHSVN